ncbi:MAG: OmpA family protein [Bacteriovorax sp.]|nr:OmpA family protein [Bacteriovorax sp.]
MKKTIVALSVIVLMLAGCASSENKNTYRGAGIGAAAGGVLGAVVGHGKGAAVGAVIGGTMGGLVGRRMDKQAKELEAIAETKRTEQGLVTKLKSDILFDTGKSDLKPQAKSNLGEMASIMKKYPENVLAINGYTDNTGSEAVNEALSERRAKAVRDQLVASGMPATVMSTYGRGPAGPIGDNSSKAGRQQNRRVEIEVTVDESKVPKESKEK